MCYNKSVSLRPLPTGRQAACRSGRIPPPGRGIQHTTGNRGPQSHGAKSPFSPATGPPDRQMSIATGQTAGNRGTQSYWGLRYAVLCQPGRRRSDLLRSTRETVLRKAKGTTASEPRPLRDSPPGRVGKDRHVSPAAGVSLPPHGNMKRRERVLPWNCTEILLEAPAPKHRRTFPASS